MSDASESCPYCRQPIPDAITTTALQKAPRRDVIESQVARLDNLISKLHEKRSRLLQELNTTQSATTSILPPEILSIVFQDACPLPNISQRYGLAQSKSISIPRGKVEYPQFALARVATRWRQVVFATPRLWTSFDLEITPSTAAKSFEIVQAFLTHSQTLPITVALHFKEFSGETETACTLMRPLRENAHRVRVLHLAGALASWADYISQLSHVVHLSLKLETSLGDVGSLSFDAPCSSLVLRSIRTRVQLSWSTITVLHLIGMPADICLELLGKCPNLVEYRNKRPSKLAEDDEIRIQPPLVLPHLKTFEWSVDTRELTDQFLLRHIYMPALHTLIWVEEGRQGVEGSDPRRIFFDHLPSTISVLHIKDAFRYPGVETVFDLIRGSLDVEHVILSQCYDVFVNDVFIKLTPTPGDNTSCPVMLPKLKSISIESVPGLRRLELERVLKMLEHRFLDGMVSNQQPFRLNFSTHEVAWTDESEEKLREMVKRGLNVEIYEDSKLVDWL